MSIDVPGRPARAIALLVTAFAVIGACSREKSEESPTAVALLTDPIALDSALARCNQSSASVENAECRAVRAALARLDEERIKASREDEKRAQREAEIRFEQQREALRQRDEQHRKELQAKEATDPYNLPFIAPEAPAVPKPQFPAPPQAQPQPATAADAGPAAQFVASNPQSTHQ